MTSNQPDHHGGDKNSNTCICPVLFSHSFPPTAWLGAVFVENNLGNLVNPTSGDALSLLYRKRMIERLKLDG